MGDYIKTFLLLGILSVGIILLGDFIGGRNGLYFALIFSLIMNVGAYFFSDKLALTASNAREMKREEAPEIYSIVSELSHKIDIPMPKIFRIPSNQANAFATGRGPGHSSVAVTDGIVEALSKNELKGVLAHELGHVKNRDILIATIAAVLASTIAFVSRMGIYSSSDEDRGRMGGFGIILALLAPLAGAIVQMAISREREFEADETGAEIMGDGKPLADALIKINESAKHLPMRDINPAFSSLYIASPLGSIGGGIVKLFSTHPPVEERVRRLRAL